ncbi:helix-turn-helix domain-containing protein, partial [Actinopolymorpha pittospori]
MQQLTEERRSELESVVSVGYDGSVSMRAQMVLAWFDGESAADIARRFGASKPTVYKWVDRFEEAGVAGLDDRTSTGRPRSVSDSVRSRI